MQGKRSTRAGGVKPQATGTYAAVGCGARDQISLGMGARLDAIFLDDLQRCLMNNGKAQSQLADAHAAPGSSLSWHRQSRRGRTLAEPRLDDDEAAPAGKHAATHALLRALLHPPVCKKALALELRRAWSANHNK